MHHLRDPSEFWAKPVRLVMKRMSVKKADSTYSRHKAEMSIIRLVLGCKVLSYF